MFRIRGLGESLKQVQLRAEEHDPFVHDRSLCLDDRILGWLPEAICCAAGLSTSGFSTQVRATELY